MDRRSFLKALGIGVSAIGLNNIALLKQTEAIPIYPDPILYGNYGVIRLIFYYHTSFDIAVVTEYPEIDLMTSEVTQKRYFYDFNIPSCKAIKEPSVIIPVNELTTIYLIYNDRLVDEFKPQWDKKKGIFTPKQYGKKEFI